MDKPTMEIAELGSVCVKVNSHISETTKKLQEFRRNGYLCDYYLVSSSGTRIPCHRTALASSCDFLESLWLFEYSECITNELKLDLTGSEINCILDFIYTGETQIYLFERTESLNPLLVYITARSWLFNSFADELENALAANFTELVLPHCNDLKQEQILQLENLFGRGDIVVAHEEAIYRVVANWFHKYGEVPARSLMAQVRFNFLNYKNSPANYVSDLTDVASDTIHPRKYLNMFIALGRRDAWIFDLVEQTSYVTDITGPRQYEKLWIDASQQCRFAVTIENTLHVAKESSVASLDLHPCHTITEFKMTNFYKIEEMIRFNDSLCYFVISNGRGKIVTQYFHSHESTFKARLSFLAELNRTIEFHQFAAYGEHIMAIATVNPTIGQESNGPRNNLKCLLEIKLPSFQVQDAINFVPYFLPERIVCSKNYIYISSVHLKDPSRFAIYRCSRDSRFFWQQLPIEVDGVMELSMFRDRLILYKKFSNVIQIFNESTLHFVIVPAPEAIKFLSIIYG